MRIALLCDSFPPYVSGVSTYCVELARWLLKYGHSVLIVTPKQERSVVPKGLEEAHIVPMLSIPSTYSSLRICSPNFPVVSKLMMDFKPDIIDTQAPSFLGMDGLLYSKVMRVPCIGTFHTLFTSKEYLQVIFKLKRLGMVEKASRSYHRFFYNSCNRVFTSTERMYSLLRSYGIKEHKIDIIPILFGVENVKIPTPPEVKQMKKQYQLKKNVALFLGRLSSEKNVLELVDVWRDVVREQPESTLLFIGDGPSIPALKQRMTENKLRDNVVFTGMIDHEKLISSGLLAVGDVFISASTTETLGLSGLEAMAYGLPPVLIQSQGLCEFVGDSGFVCRSEDKKAFAQAILHLFTKPQLRKRMGEKAKKIAQQYGGRQGALTIIEKYKSTIENYKNRRRRFAYL